MHLTTIEFVFQFSHLQSGHSSNSITACCGSWMRSYVEKDHRAALKGQLADEQVSLVKWLLSCTSFEIHVILVLAKGGKYLGY